MRKIVAVLLVGLTLAGCGYGGSASKPSPASSVSGQVFVQADNNDRVTVTPGEKFTVRLATQGGTGYTWDFVSQPDPAVVKLVSTITEVSPQGATPVVGGTETMVWEFEAMAAGSTALELHYLRLFEGARSVTETFTLHVTVR
ncbi:protease inhibitor I42 family protein [Candidatus Berkelbacteria bacterium]|nr:protease inhibitor I42 family protein [Candidatus Berkelbacteria bacterium]